MFLKSSGDLMQFLQWSHSTLAAIVRLAETKTILLTLQHWRPPQSFAGGCWGSASCSRKHQGKNCAPGHRMPCRYSSWMKNSECPHAEKTKQRQWEVVGTFPKDQRPTLNAKLRPLGLPHMIEFWHDTSRAASAWWSLRWVLQSWWSAEPCLPWRLLDFQGWRENWVCLNIYALWTTSSLYLVVTFLCLSIPATLLLQLLDHGFAGLHGRRLGQSLGPHQLLAPLCLPSLDGGQPAAPAAGRCVVFSIKHTVARPQRVSTQMWECRKIISCEIFTLTCPLFCLC